MNKLTDDQKQRAVEVMGKYTSATEDPDGETPQERQAGRGLVREALG